MGGVYKPLRLFDCFLFVTPSLFTFAVSTLAGCDVFDTAFRRFEAPSCLAELVFGTLFAVAFPLFDCSRGDGLGLRNTDGEGMVIVSAMKVCFCRVCKALLP